MFYCLTKYKQSDSESVVFTEIMFILLHKILVCYCNIPMHNVRLIKLIIKTLSIKYIKYLSRFYVPSYITVYLIISIYTYNVSG